jgi:hypothetical protein
MVRRSTSTVAKPWSSAFAFADRRPRHTGIRIAQRQRDAGQHGTLGILDGALNDAIRLRARGQRESDGCNDQECGSATDQPQNGKPRQHVCVLPSMNP